MEASDTKARILDAAESLIGELGIENASLRAITAKAEVNLAAVNYHFRSKDDLVEAMFARRIEPINKRRLQLLHEILAKSGTKKPAVKDLIHAFLEPLLQFAREKDAQALQFMKIIGRSMYEPGERMKQIVPCHFEAMFREFFSAFAKALPHLPPDELWWRMHFMIGAMVHSLYHQDNIAVMSKGICPVKGLADIMPRLIHFVTQGFNAPLLTPEDACITSR